MAGLFSAMFGGKSSSTNNGEEESEGEPKTKTRECPLLVLKPTETKAFATFALGWFWGYVCPLISVWLHSEKKTRRWLLHVYCIHDGACQSLHHHLLLIYVHIICFICICLFIELRPDAQFRRLPGVVTVDCVYVGGNKDWPTYRRMKDYTEGVTVTFVPQKISYEQLVQFYYESHSWRTPCSKNRQYNAGVWWHSPEQKKTVEAVVSNMELVPCPHILCLLTTTFLTADVLALHMFILFLF